MNHSRFLRVLALLTVLWAPVLGQRKAEANPADQIQYYCASQSANMYQYNSCVQTIYLQLQQQGGGGGRYFGGSYFDPNRRDFHPCDNPLLPSSMC